MAQLNGSDVAVDEIQMSGQRLREVGKDAVHLVWEVEVEGVVDVLLEVPREI